MIPSEAEARRALGATLRRIRLARGITRVQLAARLDDVSDLTLASYERATRNVTVPRLMIVCRALGVRTTAVLEEAEQLLFGSADAVRVHLGHLAVAVEPDLHPVRHWAAQQLQAQVDGDNETAELTLRALHPLAELCGLVPAELLMKLTPYLAQ